MVPNLRLKTQSKKAERVMAENQYFPYSTLIRRVMVEAYCPTLVELVSNETKLESQQRNYMMVLYRHIISYLMVMYCQIITSKSFSL